MAKRTDSDKSDAARQLGARGGRARASALSQPQRREIAQRAAKRRWSTADMPGKRNATLNQVIDFYLNLDGFIAQAKRNGQPLLMAIMEAHISAVLERHGNDPEVVAETDHIRSVFLGPEGRTLAMTLELESDLAMPPHTVRVWLRKVKERELDINEASVDRGPGWYFDSADDTVANGFFLKLFPRGPYETKEAAQEAAKAAYGDAVEFIAGAPTEAINRVRALFDDYEPYLIVKKEGHCAFPRVVSGITSLNRKRGSGMTITFEDVFFGRDFNHPAVYNWINNGMIRNLVHGMTGEDIDRMIPDEIRGQLREDDEIGDPRSTDEIRADYLSQKAEHANEPLVVAVCDAGLALLDAEVTEWEARDHGNRADRRAARSVLQAAQRRFDAAYAAANAASDVAMSGILANFNPHGKAH